MVSEFSAPAGMTVGGIAVRTAGAAGGLGFPGAAGNTAVQEHIRPANEIQTAPNHILVGIPLHFGGMHRGAGDDPRKQGRNGSRNQSDGGSNVSKLS